MRFGANCRQSRGPRLEDAWSYLAAPTWEGGGGVGKGFVGGWMGVSEEGRDGLD